MSNGRSVKEIIVDSKKGKGTIHDIIEKQKSTMADQLEASQIERMLLEEKNKIQQLQQGGQTLQPRQTQDYLRMVFAGRSPEEIEDILERLGPEHIDKIAQISAAMDSNNFANFRAFARQPSTGAKEVLDAVKTGVEVSKAQTSGGSSAKDVLEAVRLGIEVGKAKTPTTSQDSPMKIAMDYIKPIYDTMSQKDKDLYQAQLDNVRGQIVDPIAYLEKIKEVAPSLGFTQASKSGQPNIELEKIRIDQERWKTEKDWEMMRWQNEMKLKQQSEQEKWRTIKSIVAPALKKAAPVIDAAVGAGQQRIHRMGGQPVANVSTKQMATSFLCPKCLENKVNTVIDVSQMPEVAVCPTCNAEFPRAKA